MERVDTPFMLALSIRQPYAELILRGVKTIEYRTVRTHKIGERFYIYVSKTWAGVDGIGSNGNWEPGASNRGDGGEALIDDPLTPEERESDCESQLQLHRELLPTGVIVGSAVIRTCVKGDTYYEWHLTDVKRYVRHRKPTRQPQPIWFRPFAKAA